MTHPINEPNAESAKAEAILAAASRLADLLCLHNLLSYRAEHVLWRLCQGAAEDPKLAAVARTISQLHMGTGERFSLLPEGWHWNAIEAQVQEDLQSADDAPRPPHRRDALGDVGPAADAVYFNPHRGAAHEEVH